MVTLRISSQNIVVVLLPAFLVYLRFLSNEFRISCRPIITTRRYGRAVFAVVMSVRLSVCLSQAGVVSKRLYEWSWFLARRLPSTYTTLSCKEIWVSPKLRYFCLELCHKLWTLKNFATASRSRCQQEAQLSPRDRAMRRVN